MGLYINQEGMQPHNKAKFILGTVPEAVLLPVIEDIAPTHVPVCVVDNGLFEAAAVAYSQGEIDAFNHPDGRPKTWLSIPKDWVMENVAGATDYITA